MLSANIVYIFVLSIFVVHCLNIIDNFTTSPQSTILHKYHQIIRFRQRWQPMLALAMLALAMLAMLALAMLAML